MDLKDKAAIIGAAFQMVGKIAAELLRTSTALFLLQSFVLIIVNLK